MISDILVLSSLCNDYSVIHNESHLNCSSRTGLQTQSLSLLLYPPPPPAKTPIYTIFHSHAHTHTTTSTPTTTPLTNASPINPQRDQLDVMYNSDMGDMFDISEARVALQAKRLELLAECDANAKLQRRYVQYVYVHSLSAHDTPSSQLLPWEYVLSISVMSRLLIRIYHLFWYIPIHNFDQNNHVYYSILFSTLLLSFDQINAQIRGGGGSSGSQVIK